VPHTAACRNLAGAHGCMYAIPAVVVCLLGALLAHERYVFSVLCASNVQADQAAGDLDHSGAGAPSDESLIAAIQVGCMCQALCGWQVLLLAACTLLQHRNGLLRGIQTHGPKPTAASTCMLTVQPTHESLAYLGTWSSAVLPFAAACRPCMSDSLYAYFALVPAVQKYMVTPEFQGGLSRLCHSVAFHCIGLSMLS
jgi:hypothetical protein